MSSESMMQTFKANCLYRLEEGNRMLKRCLEHFNDATIWERPNNATNSVANLMLHLEGNLGQYILSSLGEQPDLRERQVEFTTQGGLSKAELTKRMEGVTEKVRRVIEHATEEELLRERMVQGFKLSGMGILIHAVEHFSYHIGQIALLTKLRTQTDLGFYEGFDLNTLNE